MTAADRITIRRDGLGGFDVHDGHRRIGVIWPDPKHEGQWFARPVPPPAQRRPSRLDAIAWLAEVPAEELAHLETEGAA
jgi:hypothetical protein